MKTITINVPDDCEVKIVKKEREEEPVIRTYQDLIDNSITIDKGYWINITSEITESSHYVINQKQDANVAASRKVAKSMLAMAMISQLIPYYGGEITDEEWKSTIVKYVIVKYKNQINPESYMHSNYYFLAFHTEEQRDEFLKYNEQLVKDYLMID